MYNSLKRIIPRHFLLKNEENIRKFVHLFHLGKNHYCPVCTKKSRDFILNQRGESLCSFCGSLPRDRRLYNLLTEKDELDGTIKLLDFSPSRSLYRQIIRKKNIEYYPSDLSENFLAKYHFDITSIPKEDSFFDVILCFHILEHIPNDAQAMKEMYRILKEMGRIYIQTPFKEGDIYENPEITSPEGRQIHFGQDDHVRIYSVDGLIQRLEKTGFKVTKNEFPGDNFEGLTKGEIILIAEK